MQYHTQLIKHNSTQGQFGDCYRTALACILDMEPEEVPDYSNNESFAELTNEWLLEKGLKRFSIAYSGENYRDLICDMSINNSGIYYLLFAQSPSKTNHCYVCLNDDIIHDPSGRDETPIGPCDDGYFWIEVLVSKQVCRVS